MKRNLIVFFLSMCTVFLFTHCSYRSKAIIESKFGTYNFTTYTIDTFRLKVLFGNEVLTDSLLSPVGSFSKIISFFDSAVNLVIINTKNNQVILDSLIMLKTGNINFSLVQFVHGQTPYIPALPNEPPPGQGNYKIRFQYTSFRGDASGQPQPFFYDSVRCIIRKNGVDIDTAVLQKYDVTKFYEATGNGSSTFTMAIENPLNGDLIDDFTSPTIGASYTGFNTVSVSGRAPTNDWRLSRIY